MIFYMLLVWLIKLTMGDFGSNKEMLVFLIKACIPFASRINWFYSCYMVLYFLSPFINKICEEFSKKILMKLIAVLLVIFSVMPSAFYFEITQDYGKGVINIILIYMLGRVINMYFEDIKIPGKFFFIVITGLHFSLDLFIYEVTDGIHNIFSRDNNILVIVASVWLFYCFFRKNYYVKAINAMATYVFPILIFHNFIMKLVMTKVFPVLSIVKFQNSRF